MKHLLKIDVISRNKNFKLKKENRLEMQRLYI